MPQGSPVTVAQLLSSNEPPRPHEAVAITIVLCGLVIARRSADGVAPAISPSTVSIDASGAVAVAGGVPGEDEQTVSLVGHLLVEMLGHPGSERDGAVPPRLRATAIRAATSGHEAFASLAHLVAALKRHAPEQRHAAVRAAFNRWRAAVGRPPEARLPGPSGAARVERRRNGAAPDVMTRFQSARPSRARFATALVAGATLLLLAGAGVLFLFAGDRAPVGMMVPRSRPIPDSPRREAGWELLGKPERASGGAAPGVAAPHRSATRGRAGVAVVPPELNDTSNSGPVPRQPER